MPVLLHYGSYCTVKTNPEIKRTIQRSPAVEASAPQLQRNELPSLHISNSSRVLVDRGQKLPSTPDSGQAAKRNSMRVPEFSSGRLRRIRRYARCSAPTPWHLFAKEMFVHVNDPFANDVLKEIAALFASAYSRYSHVQRMLPAVNKELANGQEQRVHEGG